MSNTSTTDKVVAGGALVGGLLFFGFLTNTCTSPFSIGGNDAKNESNTTPVLVNSVSNDDSRVAKLEKQINALKLKNADLSELEKDNDALRSQVVGGQKALSLLKTEHGAEVSKLQKQLNSMTAGDASDQKINELTRELSNQKNKSDELEKELAGMKTGLAGTNPGKAAMKAKELMGTVKNYEVANESLRNEIKKLNLDIAKLKEQNMADSANTDQEKLDKATAKMKGEIKELNTELAGLKTELKAKTGEISRLSAQVNQFKAQKNVFAKSTDDLPKTAQTLFADLKTLEGKSAEDVKKAYEQITKKNNSEAKARIKFASGKDELSAEEKAKIASLTQSSGENSYFLIVGYADKTGTAAANETLSSARSTSVAKELSSKAKGFQAAQAVYLGQTDRFGPEAENRVVEIWEIK